jgi:hypothetical protein
MTNFQLRKQPREEAGRLILVEKGSKVQVEKVDGEWGKITVKKLSGYAKMTWLCQFRAHNPLEDQVPGLPHQVGVVRVDQAPEGAPTYLELAAEKNAKIILAKAVPQGVLIGGKLQVAVPGYKGNLLIPGDVLAVNYFDQEEAKAYMMREVVTLPADYVTFTSFAPWKEAQPGDLLYGFTTFYNEHTGGKLAQNRAHNINVAGKKLDGITVQPGEALSFNGVCSPYRGSNGYLIAPIVGGDGKGYGGGVCQLSTTLYNAALGLPLRIDEWKIHSQQGVDYAPLYFDATVGAYSDLAFTNLLPYAVHLQVLPQNGVLTVLIYRDGASSN